VRDVEDRHRAKASHPLVLIVVGCWPAMDDGRQDADAAFASAGRAAQLSRGVESGDMLGIGSLAEDQEQVARAVAAKLSHGSQEPLELRALTPI